ncbi:hypothetical protein LXA43DRAFT_1064645 [Ganoderma leucocontextum]|nr:hypothetical protein LXA43DRAFT_1064645 [Ganoderma leucocontextum]
MSSPTLEDVDQVWLLHRRSNSASGAHIHSLPQSLASAPVAASCPVPGRSGTHATVPNMDEAAWVTEVPVSDAIIRTQSVFTGRSDSTAQPTLESSHYTLEPGRPYIERTYSASSLLRGLDDPFNSWPYSGEGCLTHWHRYSPPIHHETTVSSPSTPEYSQVAAPIPTYAADSDLYYGSAEAMSGQGHVQGIYTHSPPSAASASVGSIASSPHFTPTLSALGATENFQLLYPEVDIDVYETVRCESTSEPALLMVQPPWQSLGQEIFRAPTSTIASNTKPLRVDRSVLETEPLSLRRKSLSGGANAFRRRLETAALTPVGSR